MKISNRLFSVLLIMFFIGCSNPIDRVYSKENSEQDALDLRKELSTEDFTLLVTHIFQKQMKEENMLGLTYKDLLEEARKKKEKEVEEEKERKILQEKLRDEELKRIAKLKESLTVTLYDKGYKKTDFLDYLTYKFAFQNNTGKDIKAFKGTVILNDLFDEEIKSFNLSFDEGVEANSLKKWNAQTDYNQFMTEDNKIKNKKLGDFKIQWIPEKIIFADGTELE